MKKLLLPLFAFLTFNVFAQLPNGSIAPNFVATDLNGNEHHLYDILASGRDVIIDFSATWCGPCWGFHTSGILEELYHDVGPDGSNEAMILMVECDVSTTLEDLYGTGNNTVGNWVEGTNYPILDNSNIASAYQIGSYPTIMKICQDRKVELIGNIRTEGVEFGKTELNECPSVSYPSEPFFFADKYVGCGELEVQFEDNSWPRPDAWFWDFGDGYTSTEQSPKHTYSEAGDYAVTLKVENFYGENTVEKADLIRLGIGDPQESQKGGAETKDIGGGRYFEGGHQALIFNAEVDIIIGSVKVFSDKEQTRTVVLLDGTGELVQSKQVDIPVGEHRIELEFFVQKGENYRLGLRSDAFLFRNDSGVNYPYNIDGLLSIHSSTASTAPFDYYYYYYDWEVREVGCINPLSDEDVLTESIALFPNPTNGILNIQTEFTLEADVRVYNVLGKEIAVVAKSKSTGMQIDLSALANGMYFVEIKEKLFKVMLDK